MLHALFAGWLLLLSLLSEGSIVARVALFLRVHAFASFICLVALVEVLAWSLVLVVF